MLMLVDTVRKHNARGYIYLIFDIDKRDFIYVGMTKHPERRRIGHEKRFDNHVMIIIDLGSNREEGNYNNICRITGFKVQKDPRKLKASARELSRIRKRVLISNQMAHAISENRGMLNIQNRLFCMLNPKWIFA